MAKAIPIILSIDTSCDETAASVTRGFEVLSNVLSSQISIHKEFGGVVPSLAKIAHKDKIDYVVNLALKRSGLKLSEIDCFAVTFGPGLAIALEVGIKKAQELARENRKPLIAINHMEGHLFSSLATPPLKNGINLNSFEDYEKTLFPLIGFLISGGHTELVYAKNFKSLYKIGETLDDSAGEAFDKCGRMLGLGYPAGPLITRFAKDNRKNVSIKKIKKNQSNLVELMNKRDKSIYSLPIPMLNSGDLNFSFSGLKTAFSQIVQNIDELTKNEIYNLSSLLEASIIEQLSSKLKKSIEMYEVRSVLLGGGVIASAKVRSYLRNSISNSINLKYPYNKRLTGDNAGMIGIVGFIKFATYGFQHNPEKGIYLKDYNEIDREPSLEFGNI